MSYYQPRASIDPLTMESIIARPVYQWGVSSGWSCGCNQHPKDDNYFHLCDYHEGYDEGIDYMRRTQARHAREYPSYGCPSDDYGGFHCRHWSTTHPCCACQQTPPTEGD